MLSFVFLKGFPVNKGSEVDMSLLHEKPITAQPLHLTGSLLEGKPIWMYYSLLNAPRARTAKMNSTNSAWSQTAPSSSPRDLPSRQILTQDILKEGPTYFRGQED